MTYSGSIQSVTEGYRRTRGLKGDPCKPTPVTRGLAQGKCGRKAQVRDPGKGSIGNSETMVLTKLRASYACRNLPFVGSWEEVAAEVTGCLRTENPA